VFRSPELIDVSRETFLRNPQQASAIFDLLFKIDRHCVRAILSHATLIESFRVRI
jgi:hypothetical protein